MSLAGIQNATARQVASTYSADVQVARPQSAPVDGNETPRTYNSQAAPQQASPKQQGGWLTRLLGDWWQRSEDRRSQGKPDRWWQNLVDWGVDRFKTYRTGEPTSATKGGWFAKLADWGVSRYRRYRSGLAPEAGADGTTKKKNWFTRVVDWGIDRYRESRGGEVQEQRNGIWATLARGALNWWNNRKNA